MDCLKYDYIKSKIDQSHQTIKVPNFNHRPANTKSKLSKIEHYLIHESESEHNEKLDSSLMKLINDIKTLGVYMQR